MSRSQVIDYSVIPSVDDVLCSSSLKRACAEHGRAIVTEMVRDVLEHLRGEPATLREIDSTAVAAGIVVKRVRTRLERILAPSLLPVRNLTGTVLHTNLGRALLPPEAIEAVKAAAGHPTNLEFDLSRGGRGDRDSHLETWLCRLTGAEAATVVNNNAAAILLALNTLALRREVIVSRGELIEIGGSFRLPEIMKRAGCRLREVGTTNRTRKRDYRAAVTDKTGLLLKVHTSNYTIQGFTKAVPESEVSEISREFAVPFMVDLGSGALVDLKQYGLPHEATPAEVLKAGADLVTFSGDKLLGGPQAGLIVGSSKLIDRIKRNPLKRALRVDKMTIAALGALLPLYANPADLAGRIPTLGYLTRAPGDILPIARKLAGIIEKRIGTEFGIEVEPCRSQIGSGALPVDTLPSFALVMRPLGPKRYAARALRNLSNAFRALPTPVIGRIHNGAFMLDLRCLEDSDEFSAEIDALNPLT